MLTERDLENPDPLRLDREIARAAAAVRAHGRNLAEGDGDGWDDDPFVTTRMVAGRTAFLAVQAMPDLDPLKASLLRWVYRLAEQRINRAARVREAAELRLTEHVVSEPERARITLSEMRRRGLASPKRREAWLGSFIERSEALGVAAAARWERRQEVAERLALSGPDLMEGIGARATDAARDWLDRTRDAFIAAREDRSGGASPSRASPGLGGLVSLGLAQAAVEGWPRHLLPRTILDLFRETEFFRSLDLDPGKLPEAFGPSSFLRALAQVGAAWVDATAPTDQPFVVAHDPYGLRRRTMGALLGTLPASSAFARRALGVDGARLADHRRALSRAVLVASRIAALRLVLRGPALSGRRALREAFEGEVHRELGLALPPTAAGAVFQLHDDDAQRFAGLLLAARTAASLREKNDEDWYRNPRTVEQLRDEARLSPEATTTDEALAEGARALETALFTAL